MEKESISTLDSGQQAASRAVSRVQSSSGNENHLFVRLFTPVRVRDQIVVGPAALAEDSVPLRVVETVVGAEVNVAIVVRPDSREFAAGLDLVHRAVTTEPSVDGRSVVRLLVVGDVLGVGVACRVSVNQNASVVDVL